MSKHSWRSKQPCYCVYELKDEYGNVFPDGWPLTLPLAAPPVRVLTKTCMNCVTRAFGTSNATRFAGARLFLEDLQKKGDLTADETAQQIAVQTAIIEESR